MKRDARKILWILAGLIAVITASTAAVAGTTQLKFAHTMSITDTFQEASLKFADLVKAKTNGSLEIKVYPAGQLGGDPQMLQGVRVGSIDIAATGVPWYTTFAPWPRCIEPSFYFSRLRSRLSGLDGDFGQELSSRLESVGIKGLGIQKLGSAISRPPRTQ